MLHGRPHRSPLRAALLTIGAVLAAAACAEIVTQVGLDDIVSLRVSPDTATVSTARTTQLRAYPLDASGTLIAGHSADWSSENPGVATVDDSGLVTGVSPGTTDIVATIAGLEARTFMTVTLPPAIALSEDSVGFATTAGGADPAADSIRITNGGASSLTGLAIDSIVYGSGATGWLDAQLRSSTAPTDLALMASAVGITTAGTYLATVWVSGIDADNSPAALRVSLRIDPGAAANITIAAGDAQTATAGSQVATPPSALVTDAFNNAVPGVQVTFAITGGSGSATGLVQTTNASGRATVGSWTLGTTAGANTIDATAVGIGTVRFTATGTAGAAASLRIEAGDNQAAVAGSSVAVPPSVAVVDANDNGVEGVAVTFAVASGGGSVTAPAQTSAANGVATVGSWTLGTSAGANTLRVTAAGLTDTVTVTATALSGTATAIQLEAGNNQIDTVAATLPEAYAVKVVDNFGNGVAGIPVSWSVTGGGGSIGPSSTTDANGVATSPRVLGTMVGPHTAQGAVGGLSGSPVAFNATATVGAPALFTTVQGTPQTATVATNVSVAPRVRVTDQFTNPIAGHSVTFAVTAGGGTVNPTTPVLTLADGTATATSWTLGTGAGTNNNTLSATAPGGLTGNPRTFTASATPGAPNSIAVQSGTGQTAVTGNNVANPPMAIVRDQFNNPVPGVTVNFSASGGGSAGTPAATTNASGVATSTWTVSTTGSTMGTNGTYTNTLTATVQGTAISTQFSGFARYSYVTHVNPIWANCTGCHGGASGLFLDGTAAANYAELVNVIPVCDAFPAGVRVVSPAGGVAAADNLSVLMMFVDAGLAALPAGNTGACGTMPSMIINNAATIEIIRAWIRNGAPNN